MRYLSLLLSACVCGGCVSDYSSAPMNHWKRKDFKFTGISIDIPRRPRGVLIEEFNESVLKKIGFRQVRLRLRPIPLGFMVEPFYQAEVTVLRMSPENYQRFLCEDLFASAYSEFRDSRAEFCEGTQQRGYYVEQYGPKPQKHHWLVLRRDFICENGDYIVCGGKLYSGADEVIYSQEDHVNAMIRILDSVREI